MAANGEEDAYALIETELDIKPLKLGYIPNDMKFSEVHLGEGIVYIEFTYKNDFIYFIQSKDKKQASISYKSDLETEEESEVFNKWLGKDLSIKKDTHADGKITYETSIIIDGVCYRLVGAAEGDIFTKMAAGLLF